jgi:hypothetical protein
VRESVPMDANTGASRLVDVGPTRTARVRPGRTSADGRVTARPARVQSAKPSTIRTSSDARIATVERGRRGHPAKLDAADAKKVREIAGKLRLAEAKATEMRDQLAAIAKRTSQAAVANELGVDRQVVQSWLKTRRKGK